MAKRSKKDELAFVFRKHRFRVIADKVLLFRFFGKLHGRFWGLTGVAGILLGATVCFAIRPDLFKQHAGLSAFATDVRTAPYFAGSMFFAAYGLWRWRNYLVRTLKRSKPVIELLTLTILGLYIVAFMPIAWRPWPYYLHIFGMTMTGASMAATVVFDALLSKVRVTKTVRRWRLLKLLSFLFIIIGGWITLGSTQLLGWYNNSLEGEAMMLLGYSIWISAKTYQGEGNRSVLSKLLKDIVLID
jgi:multisubunit Na+/H+ antiporter MnhG subunit